MTAKRATVAISHRQTIPGLPGHYTPEAVVVVKEMLKEVTDHLGGMGKFVKPGDNVIIKPNLAFPVGPDDGATTDPRALEALIELIRDEVPGVGEIVVGEGSACLGWIEGLTGDDVFSATGMTTLAERVGVRLIDWEEDERVPVQVEGAVVLPDFEVPRSLHEADVFINLPKLKTHVQGTMTLSVKALQGIFHRADKNRAHAQDLFMKHLETLRYVRPALNIVEGLYAMQGQGPLSPYPGDVIPDFNTLIAGADPIATDAVSTAVVGMAPEELEYCRLGDFYGYGVGKLENIEVRGTPITAVQRDFKRPVRHLYGVFPNVNIYMHGACTVGCISAIRTFLDGLYAQGLLEQLPQPLNIVLGHGTFVPDDLPKDATIVYGDCAAGHRDRGAFFPGCPDLKHIIESMPEFVWGMLPLE